MNFITAIKTIGIGTLLAGGGACVFANIRVVPNGNSNNVEASIGFVWQLSSPKISKSKSIKIKHMPSANN
jgi:hypothetical protein